MMAFNLLVTVLVVTLFITSNCKVIFTPITVKQPAIITVDNNSREVFDFDIYDNNVTQYTMPYIISNNEPDPGYLDEINICRAPESGNIIECVLNTTTTISTCQIFINSANKWTESIQFNSISSVAAICLDNDDFLVLYENNDNLKYMVVSIDKHQEIIIDINGSLSIPTIMSNYDILYHLITNSNFKCTEAPYIPGPYSDILDDYMDDDEWIDILSDIYYEQFSNIMDDMNLSYGELQDLWNEIEKLTDVLEEYDDTFDEWTDDTYYDDTSYNKYDY